MKPVPLSRYLVFFSIAATGCTADLVTKHWMFAWLGMPGHETKWLWTGLAGFQTSLNEGALFGVGQGWTVAFICLSFMAAGMVLYWLFFRRVARDLFLTVVLACVTAGILGNLYDRLGFPQLRWGRCPVCAKMEAFHYPIPPRHRLDEPVYAVRDWIKVVIIRYDWPNFNLADSLLVCGCIALFWRIWRPEEQEGK